MIGFYNHTVILTYLGLVSAITGITFATQGHFLVAIICLLIAGCCDMFDGRVARAMKDRTEDAKNFGIQIDSLCDLVCFTVLPAMIGYCLGGNRFLGTISAICIVLGGVIRLGYFNVMELKRQQETTEHRHEYTGLPVTTTALILPIVFLLRNVCGDYFATIYQLALILISLLFLLRFKIKKPGTKGVIGMTILGIGIGIAEIIIHTGD